MTHFAIIETGGKQYRVSAGDKIKIEKIDAVPDGNISFDKVLLRVEGENVSVGSPYVSGAAVDGKAIRQARDKKKIIFKYHSKTRFHKKKGHRQHFTEVEVVKV